MHNMRTGTLNACMVANHRAQLSGDEYQSGVGFDVGIITQAYGDRTDVRHEGESKRKEGSNGVLQ